MEPDRPEFNADVTELALVDHLTHDQVIFFVAAPSSSQATERAH